MSSFVNPSIHLLFPYFSCDQLEVLINEEQLKEEIRFLRENLQVRSQLTALMADRSMSDNMTSRESLGPEFVLTSPLLQLLLKWCQAVCEYYAMKVRMGNSVVLVITRTLSRCIEKLHSRICYQQPSF